MDTPHETSSGSRWEPAPDTTPTDTTPTDTTPTVPPRRRRLVRVGGAVAALALTGAGSFALGHAVAGPDGPGRGGPDDPAVVGPAAGQGPADGPGRHRRGPADDGAPAAPAAPAPAAIVTGLLP